MASNYNETGFELGDQLHVGEFTVWKKLGKNHNYTIPIKPSNTFWTSSREDYACSAWIRFLNDFRDRYVDGFKDDIQNAERFEIINNPDILVLKCDNDMLDIAEYFGVKFNRKNSSEVINTLLNLPWQKISQKWDAVHVPSDFDRMSVLKAWDCESTAWFRPEFNLKHIARESIFALDENTDYSTPSP